MNDEVKIETGVKIPRGKKVKADEERRAKLFRDYVYWYSVVYVKEPVNMQVNKGNGYISWEANGKRQPAVSEKRLKELTSMLKSRTRGSL